MITRCLGTQTDVEVDIFSELLSEGDTFVLCTDGLSGSIVEEDLYSIVNQFVPQESVYHLVERANENGGPDNITAIVVRVLEVGADLPFARYPVPAGSHEADMDTAVMSRVPTSSLGVSSQAEDGVRWSPALEATAGPLSALSSNASPSPATAPLPQPTRRRLLYPAFALIVLIFVIFFGGGAYYVAHSSSQLSNARSLINQANVELRQNPVDALQHLSQAQNALLSTQGPLLVGDQATQYNTLQGSLRQAMQKATVVYNQKELITQLPCNGTQSALIDTKLHPMSLSTLQDGNNKLYSYVLASDHNLYQLDGHNTLTSSHTFANNAHVLHLAASGPHLFALTSPAGQAVYNISLLSLDQPPALKEDQASVDSDLIKQGWVPTFLTSYDTGAYLVLTATKFPRQAIILGYDVANWHNPAQRIQISVPTDIVSVAAFPNRQLFLLTTDGHVKTLQYDPTVNNLLPYEVSLQNPVSPPLANDGRQFAVNTPIATPVPQSSRGGISALSDMNLLTTGLVGGNPHLYLVDNPNHRIMDLEFIPAVNMPQTTPAPTPTSTTTTPTASPTASPTPSTGAGAVSQASLKLIQQFASTSILSSVKSATVSSDGKQLYLLTQTGSTLATISSIDKNPSC